MPIKQAKSSVNTRDFAQKEADLMLFESKMLKIANEG